jgi:hypothetical protein
LEKGGTVMHLQTIILTIIMSLVMGGALFAQQETDQTGVVPGVGEEHRQPIEGFTGTLDREGEEYVLKVGDRTYQLEAVDEQMAQEMVGQEVEVRGFLEEETIQAETIYPTDALPDGLQNQQMEGGASEQPMGGTETEEHLGPGGVVSPGGQQLESGGAEQPMGGTETEEHLGPGGVVSPGGQQLESGGAEQPMTGNATEQPMGETGTDAPGFQPGWQHQEKESPLGTYHPEELQEGQEGNQTGW